jgi:hypothetical protein
MRTLLVGFGILIAGLVANISSASAEYNGEWCIADGLHGTGSLDCAYHTFQQCLASSSGNGGTCVQNPELLWQRSGRLDRREGQRATKRQRY